ncbi:MAG: UTP--glucose-1-phosphate uridylyltransferase [Deltaproteobacteria bacterium]|nr:UTP--glucose-1-phosphate uridylyltransferase [Deltaproteobacteria bacterium]
MRRVRKAVIPAAGIGTRFLPITKVVPKEILPIGRKPVIQYVVEEAIASGIEEIIFIISPGKEMIVDYFRSDPVLESVLGERGKREEIELLGRIPTCAKVSAVYQRQPLGLGHAVLCAKEAVGNEDFLVILPDVVVDAKVPACRQLIEVCGKAWGLLMEKVPRERVSFYGIVEVERVGNELYQILGAVEKPSSETAPSDLSILGRYLLPPDVFSCIEALTPTALGEIQLTEAIDRLTRQRPAYGAVCQGLLFDVGTPEGFMRAGRHYLDTDLP